MTISVPVFSAKGCVRVPPSKSYAHRHILAAALTEGKSIVHNLHPSQDILATIDCLMALGVSCVWEGTSLHIEGRLPEDMIPSAPLSCRECGTTLRMMIPIALLLGVPVTLTGSKTLLSRPLEVYRDLCHQCGFLWEQGEDFVTVSGALQAGEYTVPANVSSQFITGLAYALATRAGKSTIRLTGKIESRSYIDLTISTLKFWGLAINWEDDATLVLTGGTLQSGEGVVEGDWSNAAPYLALNAMGDAVTMEGLVSDSLQGDRVGAAYFEALRTGTPTLSIADCPDLAPMLMACAAALHGVTLTHTERLRFKESDRGAVMAEELLKCGIPTILQDGTITVGGRETLRAPAETLSGHNDHRIVMALAVLLTRVGGTISQAESVNKSYPTFFTDMAGVGIECKDVTTNP